MKGPGDVLSETQKVWIDVLLSAGVEVELCSVKQIFEEDELDFSDDEEVARKRKRTTPDNAKKKHVKDNMPDDEDASASGHEALEAKPKPAKRRRTNDKAKSAEAEEEKENVPVKQLRTVPKDGKKMKKAQKVKGIVTGGETIVLSD